MKQPHNDPPPDWMLTGEKVAVWYYPNSESRIRYPGFTASLPWQLEDAWVIELDGMINYRDGERTTVPAAACWAVEQRTATNGFGETPVNLIAIARLAYRIGRLDAQRFAVRAIREELGDDTLATWLRARASTMPDEPVDLPSVVRAALEGA